MPPAIAARHFPTQGQFQQQLSHPEDGSRSAERAATAPPHKNSAHRTRKRNFQRANSSSGKDRNGARAEGNFQADTEAGAQPKDDALGKGVSLSDMIRSGVIKAGENNLSLTYKGVTVRLHLSPIGSIIWYARLWWAYRTGTNLPSTLLCFFSRLLDELCASFGPLPPAFVFECALCIGEYVCRHTTMMQARR